MNSSTRRIPQKSSPSFAESQQEIAQGADHHVMREFNRLLVLNSVREQGPLARVQISRVTGLSRTTVSSLIDTLLLEGLVREGEFLDANSMGGRRAMLVRFNADAGRVLGIDVGRTHLTLLMTNLAAEVIAQRTCPFAMERGPAFCLPQLFQEVRAFVESMNISWKHILGIGLGIPGPLDPQLHTLSDPPGMPAWDGVNIWQAFQQEFDIPLYVDNDANLAALGESRYGSGVGSTDLAYLKVGTGIGAGLLLGGRVYRGHGGSAGELGHVTIDENGPLCHCGNRGCLETFAGAQAIIHDARLGLSLAWLRTLQEVSEQASPVLARRSDATIKDVIEAAQYGDQASCAALAHAGERIGVALAGLVNLLNPSTIVVGGGVSRAEELFFQPLRRAVSSRSLPAAWKETRILASQLNSTAVALGAVSLVITTAFSMPMAWSGQRG